MRWKTVRTYGKILATPLNKIFFELPAKETYCTFKNFPFENIEIALQMMMLIGIRSLITLTMEMNLCILI